MGVAANRRAGGKRVERVRTRLRKGDTVLVTTGKERGKTGKILKILAEKNRATIAKLRHPASELESGIGHCKRHCTIWHAVAGENLYTAFVTQLPRVQSKVTGQHFIQAN